MSDPTSVEELPALETISALKLKDGDILVVKLTLAEVPRARLPEIMEKSKVAWREILAKAGLHKCQVVVITDQVDLSVIDVVAQLDKLT